MTQALRTGEHLPCVMDNDDCSPNWRVHFYVSPYAHTQSMFHELRRCFWKKRIISVREESQIRERDFGNFQVKEKMKNDAKKGYLKTCVKIKELRRFFEAHLHDEGCFPLSTCFCQMKSMHGCSIFDEFDVPRVCLNKLGIVVDSWYMIIDDLLGVSTDTKRLYDDWFDIMGLKKTKIMRKFLEEKDNEFKSKSLASFGKIVHWINMHSVLAHASTFQEENDHDILVTIVCGRRFLSAYPI
ncbi:hypothetical protein JHK85_010653 [Glycine max]|nr:hypothetical protein JHK85_010653 [Glycine max]